MQTTIETILADSLAVKERFIRAHIDAIIQGAHLLADRPDPRQSLVGRGVVRVLAARQVGVTRLGAEAALVANANAIVPRRGEASLDPKQGFGWIQLPEILQGSYRAT